MAEYDIRNKPGVRLGLVAARKQLGLTQQELADMVYMSRSQYAAIELGIRGASTKTWKLLKEALKVRNVEELWERYTYNDGWFIGDEGRKIKDAYYKKGEAE